MRGVYTATYKIAALAAAKTLMYLTGPSTAVIEIISASVTNSSNATNQQMECTLTTVTTLGTPTATTVTPAKQESGSAASGATIKGNVTASEPTYPADTSADYGHEGASSLGGWYFDPMPEERPTIAPSATMGLRMISTPTAMDVEVRITYREIG